MESKPDTKGDDQNKDKKDWAEMSDEEGADEPTTGGANEQDQ